MHTPKLQRGESEKSVQFEEVDLQHDLQHRECAGSVGGGKGKGGGFAAYLDEVEEDTLYTLELSEPRSEAPHNATNDTLQHTATRCNSLQHAAHDARVLLQADALMEAVPVCSAGVRVADRGALGAQREGERERQRARERVPLTITSAQYVYQSVLPPAQRAPPHSSDAMTAQQTPSCSFTIERSGEGGGGGKGGGGEEEETGDEELRQLRADTAAHA